MTMGINRSVGAKVALSAVALLGMASTASAFSLGLASLRPAPGAPVRACSSSAGDHLLPHLSAAAPRARSAQLVVMAAKKKVPVLGPACN